MYTVDNKDHLVKLTEIPQSSPGAPLPIAVATESDLMLAYYTNNDDGTEAAGIGFERYYAHMFGPPSDEAIRGHPLHSRGLKSYAAYEVLESSWIRQLEKMNAVHPQHDRKWFLAGKRHFLFTFDDSTFECIAHGYEAEVRPGSVRAMAEQFLQSIR